MKHRNIMAVIIFSIITLGIYDLFWLVSVKKELNAKTNVHTPSLWVLFAPFIVLFGVLIVLLASGANGSSHTAVNAGVNVFALLAEVVAIVVLLPVYFYWFFKFSKAVNAYTNGGISTAVAFILLWLLRFIGMAVIQDKFNDMLTAGATPQADPGTGFAPTAPQAPVNSVPPADQNLTITSPAPAAPQSPVAPTPLQPPVEPTNPGSDPNL